MLNQPSIQTKLTNILGTAAQPSDLKNRVIDGQITLSNAEKDKLKKQILMKSQVSIFKQLYPELIERGQIKYPIDDKYIK